MSRDLVPRRGARAGQHPGRGAGAARRQPLGRHADRRHVRLRAGVLRPLRRRCGGSTSSRTTSSSRLPGTRASLSRYGTVPASPENMARALERDAALLVYPGGDHETYRPTWESANIDFAGRTGFARLAHRARRADRPVVAIGGQETALFLGQGRRISQARCGSTAAAAEGVPGADGAAVRGHGARPAAPHPAPVEDHGPGAPARSELKGARPGRRLRARHGRHAARPQPARRRAQHPGRGLAASGGRRRRCRRPRAARRRASRPSRAGPS